MSEILGPRVLAPLTSDAPPPPMNTRKRPGPPPSATKREFGVWWTSLWTKNANGSWTLRYNDHRLTIFGPRQSVLPYALNNVPGLMEEYLERHRRCRPAAPPPLPETLSAEQREQARGRLSIVHDWGGHLSVAGGGELS